MDEDKKTIEVIKDVDLVPVMAIPPMALQVWNRLTIEERIKAVWFADESIPNTPGKQYIVNPFGYWFDC